MAEANLQFAGDRLEAIRKVSLSLWERVGVRGNW